MNGGWRIRSGRGQACRRGLTHAENGFLRVCIGRLNSGHNPVPGRTEAADNIRDIAVPGTAAAIGCTTRTKKDRLTNLSMRRERTSEDTIWPFHFDYWAAAGRSVLCPLAGL